MLRRYFLVAFALCWAITLVIALQVQGILSTTIIPPPVQWLIGLVPVIAAWWVTRGTDQRAPWKAAAFKFRAEPRWNLVTTVYSFAAMDNAMTTLLALVTVTALGLDQARGRLAAPEPAT